MNPFIPTALAFLTLASFRPMTPPPDTDLAPALRQYCAALPAEFSLIPAERQAELREIGAFIAVKRKAGQTARLTYICTHNSRRSQFGQAWAAAAAAYYGLPAGAVESFSGGTEATAFHPNAIAALQRAGFQIGPRKVLDKANPQQEASYSAGRPALVMFSKKYAAAANPQKEFCAVMVCDHADEACPVVYGAEARVAVPYLDPKRADGTPEEARTYDEACRLIARETFYAFACATGRL